MLLHYYELCRRFLRDNEEAMRELESRFGRKSYHGTQFRVFKIVAALYDSDDSDLDEEVAQAFPAYAALEKTDEYKRWAVYRDSVPAAEGWVSKEDGMAMNAKLCAALRADALHLRTQLEIPLLDDINGSEDECSVE